MGSGDYIYFYSPSCLMSDSVQKCYCKRGYHVGALRQEHGCVSMFLSVILCMDVIVMGKRGVHTPPIAIITYLDLVPPVPLVTSGSSLAPFWTVRCNIFNLLPLEVDHLQILVESSVLRLHGTPCFTHAVRWSPGYCHLCHSMIW